MQAPVPVTATLESRVEVVEEAEAAVQQFAERIDMPEADRYFVALAVREIVINAIRHGNRFDPSKKVVLHIARSGGSLKIDITDEGDGFRLEDVPDPRAPENLERQSGRGLAMSRSIMDELYVEPVDGGGTRVRMIKHLGDSSDSVPVDG